MDFMNIKEGLLINQTFDFIFLLLFYNKCEI